MEKREKCGETITNKSWPLFLSKASRLLSPSIRLSLMPPLDMVLCVWCVLCCVCDSVGVVTFTFTVFFVGLTLPSPSSCLVHVARHYTQLILISSCSYSYFAPLIPYASLSTCVSLLHRLTLSVCMFLSFLPSRSALSLSFRLSLNRLLY